MEATLELNKTTKTDLLKIDPRSIVFDPKDNPRVDYGNIEELKSSIRESGVREPLKIKNTPEGVKLVHGYRRMTSVLSLIDEGFDVARVPCMTVARGYNDEEALFDHIICNTGKPLTCMEEANIYTQLINAGYTQAEIAKRIGKTQCAVSNILSLLKLTKKVQKLINDGIVSASLARELMKDNNDDANVVESILISKNEQNDGKVKKITAKSLPSSKSKFYKVQTVFAKFVERVPEDKIEKFTALQNAFNAETDDALIDELMKIL